MAEAEEVLQSILILSHQIKVSFLVVGHTHENIDQMFSCFARRLTKREAHTLLDLMAELTIGYTPNVSVSQLTTVFDVKGWMAGSLNDITGHIHQHQFKLVRDDQGWAVLFYKKWSSSPEWLPEGGIRLLSQTPKGKPEIVTPNITNGMAIEKMEQGLPKYRLKLSDEEMEWWHEFVKNQRQRERKTISKTKWNLSALGKKQDVNAATTEAGPSTAHQELQRLISKEEREVQVNLRAK